MTCELAKRHLGTLALVALAGMGCSRSALRLGANPGDGGAAGSGGSGGVVETTGGTATGGTGGSVLPVCHLALAQPSSMDLVAFSEGDADASELVVLDPGSKDGPAGPTPARVAVQAISEDANFWHPELRIADFGVGADWPQGIAIQHAPTLVGTDAHAWGQLAPGLGGGLALLWFRGDEAAGKPEGLKFRTLDTSNWEGGPEVFVDSEGGVAHTIRAGKLDGTPGGPDGYVAAWSTKVAVSAVEAHMALLDASGAIVSGPHSLGAPDPYVARLTDVIWTGKAYLAAVGATVCQDGGPPCIPAAMNILRLVLPSAGGTGMLELAASIPLVNSAGEPRRPLFARVGDALWVAWSEKDPGDESMPRRYRLTRLDASGALVGLPKTLAENVVPAAALSLTTTSGDMVLAWGEVVDAKQEPWKAGHSRIVVHHLGAEGAPIDMPIAIPTTELASDPSISMVVIQHPWSLLAAWGSQDESNSGRSIIHLSRLDCAPGR